MAWNHYRLKFRLQSPIHIGYRKVGNLMQTRPYVPGKNIWAALTARLTRDYHDGSNGMRYKTIGDMAQQYFRFGYLWPSLDGDRPFFPWDHEEDFDYLLLDSYTSTALDHSTNAAQEGLLHETEFISPMTRDSRAVHLLGDLWVKDDSPDDISRWQEAVKNLQLGGERSYGWGRLSCDLYRSGSNDRRLTTTGHKWEEDRSEVVLTLNQGDHLTAHALANGDDAVESVVGEVEPVVGRDWDQSEGVHKPSIETGLVYFAPGSKVNQRVAKFKISSNGRWRRH